MMGMIEMRGCWFFFLLTILVLVESVLCVSWVFVGWGEISTYMYCKAIRSEAQATYNVLGVS